MIAGYWYNKTYTPVSAESVGSFLGVRRPERYRITVAVVGEVSGWPYTFPIEFIENG